MVAASDFLLPFTSLISKIWNKSHANNNGTRNFSCLKFNGNPPQ